MTVCGMPYSSSSPSVCAKSRAVTAHGHARRVQPAQDGPEEQDVRRVGEVDPDRAAVRDRRPSGPALEDVDVGRHVARGCAVERWRTALRRSTTRRRMLHDERQVDRAVGGRDDDAVGRADRCRAERHRAMSSPSTWARAGRGSRPRRRPRAAAPGARSDGLSRSVADVLLVGDAEEQDARAAERLAMSR